MPINWNLAGYVNPDIKITPTELPLQAMVNTGDELQKRYDASYENYTKTQEALRQMVNAAHPNDREEAEKIFSRYEPELKKIAESGKFHDMRWQTQKLANEAANDYLIVSNKNKQIQANLDAISKDPRWQFTRDKRQQAYLKSVPKLGYDPEKGFITGTNVTPYTGAADVNYAELAAKAASIMKPKDFGSDIEKLTYYDSENKITNDPMKAYRIVATNTSNKDSVLTPEQIRSAVGKYMLADSGVQAEIERNIQEGELQLTGNPEEDAVLKQKYTESLINPALDAAGALFKVNNHFYGEKEKESTGLGLEIAKGLGNQEENLYGMYSPNNIFQNYGSETDEEFPDKLSKALYGDNKAKSELLSTLDGMSKDNPQAKEAKLLVKDMIEFSKKYPEYSSMLNRSTANLGNFDGVSAFQKMFTAIEHLKLAIQDSDKDLKVYPEGKKLVERYWSLANKGFFDSDFENQYEAYTKNNPSARQLPLTSFSITNDSQRQALDKMKADFNKDKFTLIEGDESKWNDDEDRKIANITGFTTEPYGAGIGMVLEVEDSKGNRFIVAPEKQELEGILGQMHRIYPQANLPETFLYKDIIPITRKNSEKSIKDILEDMPDSKEKIALINASKGYKIKMKEDGNYVLINPDGTNGPSSSSMYKLLPKLYK